jgi:hypothetical protein
MKEPYDVIVWADPRDAVVFAAAEMKSQEKQPIEEGTNLA